MDDSVLPPDETILASAAAFLIEGNDHEAASLLLACTLSIRPVDSHYDGPRTITTVDVELSGPRASYDALTSDGNAAYRQKIFGAIEALLPSDYSIDSFSRRAQVIDLDPDWRNELIELARGSRVHNQANDVENVRVWNGLRFRSLSELKVAQALDRTHVLFLPNCMARLNFGAERRNREPDFLVCDEGRWGILEVDGDLAHPPSRTVHDHDRDRLFHKHGIKVIEHYDARRCFTDPDGVAREFLELLRQA